MAQIGEVKAASSEFQWRIPNFSSNLEEGYISHSVLFAGTSWYMIICPNGLAEYNSIGYTGVYLMRQSHEPLTHLQISFAIKVVNGNKDEERYAERIPFSKVFDVYGIHKLIPRAELSERVSELLPSNILTIYCSVKYLESTEGAVRKSDIATACGLVFRDRWRAYRCQTCQLNSGMLLCPDCFRNGNHAGHNFSRITTAAGWFCDCGDESHLKQSGFCHKHGPQNKLNKPEASSNVSAAEVRIPRLFLRLIEILKHNSESNCNIATKCLLCKEIMADTDISTHEHKCMDKQIKCPECLEVFTLKNWSDHECQMARSEVDESLSEDLKKMLSDGKNYDVILQIGDKELHAHRDILRARSHVFQSMLDHDMKEKKTGEIKVNDCDPQAMEVFLSYVYTGKVETLDVNIMFKLYYIADKYDMRRLKEKCCDFIKKSFSNTNICQVILLAVNHNDSSLLEYATEYFFENTLDITVTLEWQTFLKDNTTLGNELFIKSFQKLKSTKS